jgi:hypothetical protein
MRPVALVAACLFTAIAAGGCVRSASQPATTPTTAAAASTTRGPADTTGPRTTTTTTTTTTTAARWTTAPKARTHNPKVPEDMPMLVAIRSGRHAGYDRVVLEFRNDLPGWRVRYVDKVTSESGEVVPLEGAARLYVDVSPAWAHDQNKPPYKATYTGPQTLTPRSPTLRQVRLVDEFEGHLGFGLGLQRRVGFRVLELREPARLAIDVAHSAT